MLFQVSPSLGLTKWANSLLLTAAYDKTATIVDIRAPGEAYRWKLSADVEKVEWNPHRAQEFLVSTEDGMVKKYDSLAPAETLFTLHAHSSAVGGLSLNKVVPNCLATCSEDKSFKIWDITDNKPSLVFESDSSNVRQSSPFPSAIHSHSFRPSFLLSHGIATLPISWQWEAKDISKWSISPKWMWLCDGSPCIQRIKSERPLTNKASPYHFRDL
jgi:WD40 repeat protein